jgi:zinc transporter ZupT
MTEEKTEKAGVLALIFSFLIPIVGIICYFTNKNAVKNASAYLWAALGGFVLGFIMRLTA